MVVKSSFLKTHVEFQRPTLYLVQVFKPQSWTSRPKISKFEIFKETPHIKTILRPKIFAHQLALETENLIYFNKNSSIKQHRKNYLKFPEFSSILCKICPTFFSVFKIPQLEKSFPSFRVDVGTMLNL